MDALALLRGVAFVDGAYPSGGFAHSFGLETAANEGRVTTSHELVRHVARLLQDGVGRSDAVALAVSHRAASEGDLGTVRDADERLDALKVVREGRDGSRLMGRRYLEGGAERFPESSAAGYCAMVQNGVVPGHAGVALGLVLAACGWSRTDAVAAGLYQTASGWVSAALRLLPIGQREGQRVLHALLPAIEDVARSVNDATLEAMRPSTPLHDIRSMRHARQRVRLFRS
jgi:urease accessory protein